MKFDDQNSLLSIKNYNEFLDFVENNFLDEIQTSNSFQSLIGVISDANDSIRPSDDFWGQMIYYLETLAEDLHINYTSEDLSFATDLLRINLDPSTKEEEINVFNLALYVPNKNLILNHSTYAGGHIIRLLPHLDAAPYNNTVQFNIKYFSDIGIDIAQLGVETLIVSAPTYPSISLLQKGTSMSGTNLIFTDRVQEIEVADSVQVSSAHKPTLKFTYGKTSKILPKIASEETIEKLKKLYAWT